jgi:hypothetical protein
MHIEREVKSKDQDLQIFKTSLAVLLRDLSSELTNYSAILANYLLFS